MESVFNDLEPCPFASEIWHMATWLGESSTATFLSWPVCRGQLALDLDIYRIRYLIHVRAHKSNQNKYHFKFTYVIQYMWTFVHTHIYIYISIYGCKYVYIYKYESTVLSLSLSLPLQITSHTYLYIHNFTYAVKRCLISQLIRLLCDPACQGSPSTSGHGRAWIF